MNIKLLLLITSTLFFLSGCGMSPEETVEDVKVCNDAGLIAEVQTNIYGAVIRVICKEALNSP